MIKRFSGSDLGGAGGGQDMTELLQKIVKFDKKSGFTSLSSNWVGSNTLISDHRHAMSILGNVQVVHR